MISLHYIIATYSGIYRDYENKEYVLQRQLQNLYKILVSKREQGLPCLLKRITIVCPEPHHEKTYLKYYQQSLWSYVFEREFPDIDLVYIKYKGDNQDHSYDQWIQGYLSCPEHTHNLFMEDDYCFDLKQVMFDKILVDMYHDKFPDNIGYLATWASNNNNHNLHAAISNGIISSETFKLFSDPLKVYYDMKKTETYPQLKFSYMFINNSIPLSDITYKYQALFWNSDTSKKINFASNDKEVLLYPVQFTGLDTSSQSPKRKKIAFLVNQFSIRGSEIAIYEYACYNEILLNNDSIFVVPDNHRYHRHPISGLTYSAEVEKRFKDTFPLFEFSNLEEVLQSESCDILYALKYGTCDHFTDTKIPSIVHSVFICEESHKHGDVYACISEDINKCNAPIVPHICLPLPDSSPLQLNLPKDAIVIGRHGAIETFDLEFVHRAITRAVQDNPKLYFLFMNTEKFVEHPRVMYFPKQIDIKAKASFINTCDAMIHARSQGETFGLSIAEFSSKNKPIICWKHDGPPNKNEDLHHIRVLREHGVYYKDEEDLYKILINFSKDKYSTINYSNIFTPEKVMKEFKTKLIDPLLNPKYRIKVLCNWANPTEIHKKWEKLLGDYPIKFVDENPDYWVIINKPPENELYDPSRTIVMGMEPDTFTGHRWQWFEDKTKFLYFLDENYLINWEWWLDLDQKQLLDHTPQKTKGNTISAVISSQSVYHGHRLRINFAKQAEKELNFDIFGWDNSLSFESYRGPLENGKDEGLFPYKYTFAAENTSRPNYCTEKLIDGILSECLVFYWGCPNIEDFLDKDCCISLDLEDVQGSIETIRKAIENDEWTKRIETIRRMKQKILTRYSFAPRVIGLIEATKLNKRTINLDSRPEKWQNHLDQCQKAQISRVKRFAAIRGDSYDLRGDYIHNLFLYTSNFVGENKNTGAIVGCALSHYTLWKEIVITNQPMLIMEDDVTFQARFVDRLGYLLNEINNKQWELIFLGFHNHEDNCDAHGLSYTFLTDTFSPRSIIPYQFMIKYGTASDASGLHGGGTFGYLLHPDGAKKLIDMVNKCKFYFPVDYQILECGLHYGLQIHVCPHQLLTSPKFGIDTDKSDIQMS